MKAGNDNRKLFRKRHTLLVIIIILSFVITSFSLYNTERNSYSLYFFSKLDDFTKSEEDLLALIQKANTGNDADIEKIRKQIAFSRLKLKGIDLWLRYLDPIAYKSINGPLPVEWETEVFEKYENPYYREGAGLTLMELYLDEKEISKDTLVKLLQSSLTAINAFRADSTTVFLDRHHHFFLANRLHLLNLAAIYTTGFECPNPDNIIPEIAYMINEAKSIYEVYNDAFPDYPVSKEYLELYDRMIAFVKNQPKSHLEFDHFTYTRDFLNPLYGMNQEKIVAYRVVSKTYVDYSLSRDSRSIFDKGLYKGQNVKGIFLPVDDPKVLAEIRNVGKLLFYDPRLSGNNKRSCASCHKPKEYFTDTLLATSPHFDPAKSLLRNTPSLVNVVYNHLLMLDGKHTSLQNQAKDVTTNKDEMASSQKEILEKILSCRDYKKSFKKLIRHTSESDSITMNHIVSAITFYFSDFSYYHSPFDDAMNKKGEISPMATKGFNLFMSKAQCGTCHFVPIFNGVKPPYIETEFEVLGVPSDSSFNKFDSDEGRFKVNPAKEMVSAFRTTTVRNSFHTQPYMHNGIFYSLDQVLEFYNTGGGIGKGFSIENQTLSSDSLGLTFDEKAALLEFIRSLDENIPFENPPASLPLSDVANLNNIVVGGEY